MDSREKIKREYEEGLKFLATDTGEDAKLTAEARDKVGRYMQIAIWEAYIANVEQGANYLDFMTAEEIGSLETNLDRLVKMIRKQG